MWLYKKFKVFISIMLCIFTGGNFFWGLINYIRAGDVDMIDNDHAKSFSTEYTELVPYAREHEDTISWFDGMVSGNGENGVVVAGSPYSDSYIYNNINFLMPSEDPRYTPDEVTDQLHDARQNVINGLGLRRQTVHIFLCLSSFTCVKDRYYKACIYRLYPLDRLRNC